MADQERPSASGAMDGAIDDELRAFFDAAGHNAPPVRAEFLARILADAEAMTPPARTLSRRKPQGPLFTRLIAGLGGWRGLSGLATAAAAGLWLGFSLPQTVSAMAPALSGDEDYAVDLMATASDVLMDEGQR